MYLKRFAMRLNNTTGSVGLLGVFLLLWLPSTVHAQRFGRFEEIETNVGAYYHFVQAGRSTIQVHVLGAVASPGLYEVNEGTPFGTLLTLARPQMSTGGRSDRKLDMDDVVIRLFRQSSSSDEPSFETSLEEVMLRPGENPALQDGDVLTIQADGSRVEWRDVLSVTQTIAIFALAIARVARAL